MDIILQFAIIPVVFLAVRYMSYYITEVKGLPEWLDYKPFNCNLCLTFWSLVAIYLALWFAFGLTYTGVAGMVLAGMNALAMWIDQRNKTVKI